MLVLTEQCSCLPGPWLCCPPPADHPHLPHRGQPLGPCSVLMAHSTHAHRSSSCCHGHTGTRVCRTHDTDMYTHGHRDTSTPAIDMGTQTHMHTRAHPDMCTWKQMQAHKCAHAQTCTCGHRCSTLTRAHTDACSRMDMDTCRHTHGHTHTLGRQPLHSLSLSTSWGLAPAYWPGTACSVSLGCSHGPSLYSDQAISLAQGKGL